MLSRLLPFRGEGKKFPRGKFPTEFVRGAGETRCSFSVFRMFACSRTIQGVCFVSVDIGFARYIALVCVSFRLGSSLFCQLAPLSASLYFSVFFSRHSVSPSTFFPSSATCAFFPTRDISALK